MARRGLLLSAPEHICIDPCEPNAPPLIGRRRLLAGAACAALGAASSKAHAFGDGGAFNPRILLTGSARFSGKRASAPAHWSRQVLRRTSAPARVRPTVVQAADPQLLAEPFAVWSGSAPPAPLTLSELHNLRRFVALGGVLLVDEQAPEKGAFVAAAQRQVRRFLPHGSMIKISRDNVVFRSFYLLGRATGRVQRAAQLGAIIRGGMVQVLFCSNDLLGALAIGAGDVHTFEVTPGGEHQRERAVRLAVNIAMYVLCSDYKDDQVHAPFIMRRRAGSP